ncbi:unnamed protein product [Oikopleura dioica]|uniref:SSD domain-containing protein n=1 Tax=Oikopleura dioica TaxID=34765 RepID=E4YD34_OIKDI|nr:unnamed protein product [Oikopleura dioica]
MAPAAGLLLAAVLDTVVIAVDVDVLVQLTNFYCLSSNRNLRKSVKH